MRFSSFLLFVLFVLIISSCDECTIIPPPGTNYATGDTIWIHDVPGSDSIGIQTPGNMFLSIAQGIDGSIYYGVSNPGVTWIIGRIFAINKDDGSLKWRSEPIDQVGFGSQIVVGDDGTVYVIGQYRLFAFDPDDGSTKWNWEVPETLPNPDKPDQDLYTYGAIGGLTLSNNGDLILASTGSGVYSRALYCIDKDGNTKWAKTKAIGVNFVGNAIGQNGALHYYSEINGKLSLVSVETNSGGNNWSKEIQTYSSSANNIAIAEDGYLICSFKKVGDSDFYLHKVDPANGNIVWTSSASSIGGRKLIGPDGAIYQYFQFEGGINRFDPGTGDKTPVRSGNLGAIDDKNRLLFGYITEENYWVRKLCLYDIDGTLDWAVSMDNLRDDDFIISDDKVIYGVNGNNQVFAIQGDATLAKSGWPKPAHDNRNTSNANK